MPLRISGDVPHPTICWRRSAPHQPGAPERQLPPAGPRRTDGTSPARQKATSQIPPNTACGRKSNGDSGLFFARYGIFAYVLPWSPYRRG